jgi:hypothetical protein
MAGGPNANLSGNQAGAMGESWWTSTPSST